MVTTRLTNEVLDNCTGLDIIRKPEDILDKLGTRHVGLIVAIVSCSFVWGFGALSIMSSAFTSIDCGNCTDTMVTVVSEFDLRGERSYLIEWSTSFFMIGNMIGGCTLSHAADRSVLSRGRFRTIN
ncbi:hypothetical protein NECAME_14419 [Necator americanus]|uniref:Major facilitator superfamily (MFS) profile domain-containing protein n=1 Tax=Necator americanus TaxID=51031 RepID=W2SQ14_NECAM|nr:hypothetical protein NECAME_14419 [Necator americanus]ETN70971.1 hypothetical protein NECAME_14419 [Necator americanus]